MKIRILMDVSHRISSGRSQQLHEGTEINVPKATAETLIEAGKAEALKPTTKGD